MKIAIFLQVRMGSSRLPGKALKKVCGRSVLEHIIQRLKAVKESNQLIVLTTTSQTDNPIAALAEKLEVSLFRGSEPNVLDRFYQAAKVYLVDGIVRITGDCALIDPDVVDAIIRFFKKDSWDYVSNTLIPTYPDGLDVEVFSFKALSEAWERAEENHQKEHVTPYFYENPDRFRLANFRSPVDYSAYRWLIDEARDLLFVEEVYNRLYFSKPLFTMGDVLALLDCEPGLKEINTGIERNEGFFKNLQGKKIFYSNWQEYIRDSFKRKGYSIYETSGA